ncbi:MAG: hypothetical protein NVSMB14_04240 [Isosphaeraceae bacterium]
MGKGDKRTKRGKIFKGSFGKSRPRPKKIREIKRSKATAKPAATH